VDENKTWYGGRPRPRPLCVRWGPSSPSPKRGRALQFSAHFYCDQTAGCIKMPLDMEVNLGPGHIVLDGDSTPPKRGYTPIFSAHVYCGQTAGWTKMPLDRKVRLDPISDTVLDGDPASPPQKRRSPMFSAHGYCGQTAAWIKMPVKAKFHYAILVADWVSTIRLHMVWP